MAVVTYKCPNCDGPLEYMPEQGRFGCSYCGSTFTEEEVTALAPASQQEEVQCAPLQEPEPAAAQADAEAQSPEAAEEAVLYTCPSCGAQVVTDANTAATFCFYCHNPVVLTGRLSGEYLPSALIPFTISRKDAQKRFDSWLKSKRYLPREFAQQGRIQEISGVYFPYWTGTCELQADMNAVGRVLRVWRTGDIEHTETKTYAIERSGDIRYENLSRSAMDYREDRVLVESVLPFIPAELKPFRMEYLSGFYAEKRDLELADATALLEADLASYSQSLLRDTAVGYASITDENTTLQVKDRDYQYALFPVWTMTFQSGGETYYWAMNGQTGKAGGYLPLDRKRLLTHAAAIGGLLGALLLLGGYFLL